MAVSLEQLAECIPAGVMLTDPAQMAGYCYDATKGITPAMPLAVLRPTDSAQVQTIVRFSHEHRIPITPRGAGTGLAGGAVNPEPSFIISAERLLRLDVKPKLRMAVCGAGVINSDLKNAAKKVDLWYPPDPSSFSMCTLGGNVATGAGGMCCVKYGVTRQYVLGVEVVVANGDLMRFGGPRIKDSAGYSLKDLIIGSEGTLGYITQVLMRLIPRVQTLGTVVASFPSVEVAMQAVDSLLYGPSPSVIELIEGEIFRFMPYEDLMGINPDVGALLLIQTDNYLGPGTNEQFTSELSHRAQMDTEAIVQKLTRFHPIEIYETTDPDEGEQFLHIRRQAFHTLNKISGQAFLEDISTAVAHMPALISGIKKIGEQYGSHICLVGHAGDGNLHIAICVDPHDQESVCRGEKVYDEMIKYSIAEGASITGEHGIGRIKRDYLPLQLGKEVMELHHGIKKVFDPCGIFNPGAVFS